MRLRENYSPLRLSGIAITACLAMLGSACSGSDSSTLPGETGGTSQDSTGGAANTGGGNTAVGGSSVTAAPTGGTQSAGGASTATGGATATGGNKTNGGATSVGGTTAIGTGGSKATTGGSSTLATGGVVGIGGTSTTSTGGSKPTGGATATSSTGGAATGGVTSAATGGKATGGATAAATGGKATGGATVAATGGAATGGSSSTAACTPPTSGHYQMEDLDRGVVAAKVTGGVYVGWRMMGYEYNPTSPTSIAYNVYRAGTKLATVTNSTNYLDTAGTASSTYTVSAVINGTECPQSPSVTTWGQNYINIPTTPPSTGPNGGTYTAGDASPGDLDGDGKLDIVVKWDPSNQQDNSIAGITDDVYLDGYTLAGSRLWRIDLGPNIRAGAHYTQFSVYDFDGDGVAEVACKTAPGTKDGTGAYLSLGPAASDTDSTIYRNTDGYILTGPEYLTVFNGKTGKEMATVNYPVPRGTVSSWGDSYGNRVDRFNAGIAFVKDAGTATGRPSIIAQRGYYTRMTVSALTWRSGTLATNWIFDSNGSGNSAAAGGGDHSAMAADSNGDLGQEIITGATTIASNGTFQCSSGMGHGDAMDVAELVPGKGISVFSIHEGLGGMDTHDAATCSSYFQTTESGVDSNRGRAEYVGAGNENSASCYCASCTTHQALCATGAASGLSAGSNFVMYWDASGWRDLENATSITSAAGGTLLSASGCASNNGTKSNPTLTADLLGDWREEIIYRTSDNTALRVYTTTNVTAQRIYTLMHDPTYRAQVSFEQSSYNQPPHPGFRISPNMAAPPKPDIYVK